MCYHCVSYSEAPSGVERAVLTRRASERHPFALRFDVFASFSLAFFGIGLTRLWYQYNLYNLHFSADSGIATVAANLIRVGVIVVLLAAARKAELSQRARRILVWGSMVLMTLASLCYFVELHVGTTSFEYLRYVFTGLGLVWGAGMWMDFFDRLKPSEALLYCAGGLALSCLLSLVAGYLTTDVFALFNLFLPALCVLAWLRAMKVLDLRGDASRAHRPFDMLFEGAEKRGVAQIVAALMLFAFALGMGLGYPDGSLRELSQTIRSVHQLLVFAAVALLLRWVLVRKGRFTFTAFWWFINALMIFSILLLMSDWGPSIDASAFLLTNAISFFYSFVFFTCYMIGRHSARHPMYLLGIAYGGTLLTMSLGRILGYATYQMLSDSLPVVITMSIVVVAEMVMALRPDMLHGRELFGTKEEWSWDAGGRASIECDGNEHEDAGVRDVRARSGNDGMGVPVEKSLDGSRPQIAGFADRFGLSDTERRIVALMSHGRSRKIIASTLGYSQNTIRNYTRNIYAKAGVHSKQELLDLLDPETSV